MSFGEGAHPGGAALTGRAARLAGVSSGMALLDVGCGIGQSLRLLEHKFGIIPFGIDISEKLIGMAGHLLPGAALTVGDAANLPYLDASFDVVISECVLSLIEDKKQALSEMHRVLRPLGMLILSDICGENDFGAIKDMFAEAKLEAACFEEHKAALITYAAEAYKAGAVSSCFTVAVETARSIYGNSTYYLIICHKSGHR